MRNGCALAFGANDTHRCEWCGGELPARRRKWCSDECAHAWADNHHWTAARRAALERDGYRCLRCEARPARLEVHHVHEVDPEHGYGTGCQHHADGLESLCEPCHRAEHSFRHEVERLVVWADGRLNYQMALPGIAA